MQRAKDKVWMENVKTSVLRVTKHLEREDRKFALDYLRGHIKVDDLHQQAIKKFPSKVIYFGEGSLNPDIVVVTRDLITKEQRNKLETALKKMGASTSDLYYAYLRFVKTKKKQEDRQEILERLVNILSPKLVIAFDGVQLYQLSPKSKMLYTELPAEVLVSEDGAEHRKWFGRTLKSFLTDCDLVK